MTSQADQPAGGVRLLRRNGISWVVDGAYMQLSRRKGWRVTHIDAMPDHPSPTLAWLSRAGLRDRTFTSLGEARRAICAAAALEAPPAATLEELTKLSAGRYATRDGEFEVVHEPKGITVLGSKPAGPPITYRWVLIRRGERLRAVPTLGLARYAIDTVRRNDRR